MSAIHAQVSMQPPQRTRHLDLWQMSQDQKGCRHVQQAFEDGPDGERLLLVRQLEGHVWEALECKHANHVIQKCITTTQPRYVQFVIDELMWRRDGVGMATRHRFGCRIVERLLEHCDEKQAKPLVDIILADALALSTHNYGNYVVQHMLEHGTDTQRQTLCRTLAPHVSILGLDSYACAVLGKALSHCRSEDQARLAQAILDVPRLLFSMARTRHGHITAKLVLQVAEGAQLNEAITQLSDNLESLRSSRYGRFVAAHLDRPRGSQRAGGA
jgi:pumilio RNA-binding family